MHLKSLGGPAGFLLLWKLRNTRLKFSSALVSPVSDSLAATWAPGTVLPQRLCTCCSLLPAWFSSNIHMAACLPRLLQALAQLSLLREAFLLIPETRNHHYHPALQFLPAALFPHDFYHQSLSSCLSVPSCSSVRAERSVCFVPHGLEQCLAHNRCSIILVE